MNAVGETIRKAAKVGIIFRLRLLKTGGGWRVGMRCPDGFGTHFFAGFDFDGWREVLADQLGWFLVQSGKAEHWKPHEFDADEICRHCGLPSNCKSIPLECELSHYARRARRAFDAVGLEFASIEKDRDTWYATCRSKVALGHCERRYADEVEAILKLLENKR